MMDAMLPYKVNTNEISFIMHNIVYCIDMILYVNIDFSVPSPPTNINIQYIDDTSISLTWLPPTKHSQCVTGFSINVTNTINNELTTYKSTSSQINVNGLTAGIQYLVVIAGIDKGEREGDNGYLTFEIGMRKYLYTTVIQYIIVYLN